jgi:hypothetical protein
VGERIPKKVVRKKLAGLGTDVNDDCDTIKAVVELNATAVVQLEVVFVPR